MTAGAQGGTSGSRPAARRIIRLTFAALLLAVVATVGVLWQQGYRAYVIHTGSMAGAADPGDLVVDRRPSGPVRPGEIVTFRHSDDTTDVVTHRVVAIRPDGTFTTKGDANDSEDTWAIRPDQIQGQVFGRVRSAGYAVVFFQQPAGIAAVATAALTVVLLWQLCFGTPEAAVDERRRLALPA